MAKFKIGDRVYYNCMPAVIGVVTAIRYSTVDESPTYKVEFKNNPFNSTWDLTEKELCKYDSYAKEFINHKFGVPTVPGIKKVIFNNPATIVFWNNGTKTIVKCSENDTFDPEKGLAMAIAKYHFGNDYTFHKVMKQWLPEEEPINIFSGTAEYVDTAFKNMCDVFARKV